MRGAFRYSTRTKQDERWAQSVLRRLHRRASCWVSRNTHLRTIILVVGTIRVSILVSSAWLDAGEEAVMAPCEVPPLAPARDPVSVGRQPHPPPPPTPFPPVQERSVDRQTVGDTETQRRGHLTESYYPLAGLLFSSAFLNQTILQSSHARVGRDMSASGCTTASLHGSLF